MACTTRTVSSSNSGGVPAATRTVGGVAANRVMRPPGKELTVRAGLLFRVRVGSGVSQEVGDEFRSADSVPHRSMGDPDLAVMGCHRQRTRGRRDIGSQVQPPAHAHDWSLGRLVGRLEGKRG